MTFRRSLALFLFAVSIGTASAQTCPTRPPGQFSITWNGNASLCDTHSPCKAGEVITFQLVFFGGSAYQRQECDSYAWDFGDGTPTASGLSFQHVYANEGTYTVIVTLTNALGSYKTAPLYVVITTSGRCPTRAPAATNFIQPSCATCSIGERVQFSVVTPPDGEPEACDSFAWDFGDGETSTERSPVHIFRTTGSRMVSVREWNHIGEPITISTTVKITTPSRRRAARH